MNTKSLIAIMMFVFSLILTSCKKNEMDESAVIHDYKVQNILYAKGSKLKNISYVESIKSMKGGIIITQYEYDGEGRISKVSHPMYKDGTPMFENGTIVGLFSYSDYLYNDNGLLEKIINYHSNLYEGFINLQTSTYLYDKDGNKLKEVIVYPRALPFRTDSTLYHYDNNRLKREDNYSDGYHGKEVWNSKLATYIEYEYDSQGILLKETTYWADENTPLRYSLHSYQNGVHVKTEVFTYYNIIGKTKLREIRRYYDKNDNLIYLESDELSPLSSSISYVAKYEYY